MTTTNPHAWFLKDLHDIPSNGFKVMTTFSCGGGSSMGYKRAGFEVIAANDIDPEMAYHYKLNLSPKHYFLCPIKDLITKDLPEELFNLDIFDGSPPCSSFSMAGNREKDWGKKKHFREGQSSQVLDDLFFDYLNVVDRLKPKVAIAENVKGMTLGKAKGYCKMIMQRFKQIGYKPQLFLLNAADCGVPQKRERVFFVALREDIDKPKLELAPQNRWISAGEATEDLQVLTDDEIRDTAATNEALEFWKRTKPGDSFAAAKKRITGKANGFGRVRNLEDAPSCTLTSNAGDFYHWSKCRKLTYREWKRLGSFPDDYKAKSDKIGKYMIGMSVPPKMTEVVATAVLNQWLKQRNCER
jgi:DNA (cytosine-5)-methyltransferase 1